MQWHGVAGGPGVSCTLCRRPALVAGIGDDSRRHVGACVSAIKSDGIVGEEVPMLSSEYRLDKLVVVVCDTEPYWCVVLLGLSSAEHLCTR
jgi:hypothetical protein